MRMNPLGLVALTLLAARAGAAGSETAKPTFDLQLFQPTPGANNFFSAESGDVNSHLGLSLGLNINYARNPLVVRVRDENGGETNVGAVVGNRVDADVLVALGLFDRAELGVVMPFIRQWGLEGAALDAEQIDVGTKKLKDFALGDLRVVPKVRLLQMQQGLFSVALVGNVTVPTGGKTPYAAEGGVVASPALALSTRTSLLRAALDVGYRWREKHAYLYSLKVEDEIFAKVGLAIDLRGGVGSPLEIVVEGYGQTPAQNPFGINAKSSLRKQVQRSRTPLEVAIGLRTVAFGSTLLSIGGAGGALPGYGASAPRVFVAASLYTGQFGIADADKDGVSDSLDKCPDKKEDRDGFQDDDGCPDLDNDGDGVLDEDDQCPNEPEDKDNVADDDGCPDIDNDNDGVADQADKCPGAPEDKDGFQDDDGCPDLDNDNDGIADTLDKCPTQAEDKDGFQDDDGCIDEDNDKDGLADLGDMCPNHAEDKDGVADDDGCPDDNDGDGIPDDKDKCPAKAEIYNGIEDEDGCPEALKVKSLVNVTQEKIEIKEKIFFRTNSADILPKSFDLLNQVVSVLKNYKHLTKIRIEGHTDSVGPRKRNVKLSQERADSVKRYLVGKGVAPPRLEAVGYGPDKAIASNKTSKGREQNRRVEFMIAEQKSIGQDVAELQPAAAPAIEMPDMGAPAAPPPAAGGTPEVQFEVGPGPEAAPPAAKPEPAAEPEKKGKGKGEKRAKGKKKKPEGEPAIEFNF